MIKLKMASLAAQFATQDLVDGCFGQLGTELDDFGLFVAGQVFLAIGAHLRLCL